jgi:hypothetical protein
MIARWIIAASLALGVTPVPGAHAASPTSTNARAKAAGGPGLSQPPVVLQGERVRVEAKTRHGQVSDDACRTALAGLKVRLRERQNNDLAD